MYFGKYLTKTNIFVMNEKIVTSQTEYGNFKYVSKFVRITNATKI